MSIKYTKKKVNKNKIIKKKILSNERIKFISKCKINISDRDKYNDIVLVSIPKPYNDEYIFRAQIRAMVSWKNFTDNIYTFGSESYIPEVCDLLNIRNIKKIKTTKDGTPFLSDAIKQIHNMFPDKPVAFINSDIIISDPEKIRQIIENICIYEKKFILMSQCYNIPENIADALCEDIISGSKVDFDDNWIR